MELLPLYAKRLTEGKFKKTVLYDASGKVVAIYPPEQKQPSKNRKTITHNCFKYSLTWLN